MARSHSTDDENNQPAPAPAQTAPPPAASTEDRLKKLEEWIEKYGPRITALTGE
jgi:hypothetical protein